MELRKLNRLYDVKTEVVSGGSDTKSTPHPPSSGGLTKIKPKLWSTLNFMSLAHCLQSESSLRASTVTMSLSLSLFMYIVVHSCGFHPEQSRPS